MIGIFICAFFPLGKYPEHNYCIQLVSKGLEFEPSSDVRAFALQDITSPRLVIIQLLNFCVGSL